MDSIYPDLLDKVQLLLHYLSQLEWSLAYPNPSPNLNVVAFPNQMSEDGLQIELDPNPVL
jgi:hypothetical protein